MRQIDIFGDGEYIYSEDNIPDEITKECGCVYKNANPSTGISFYLYSMCNTHQDEADANTANQSTEQDIQEKEALIKNRENQILRNLAITELKDEGQLPQDYE